MGNDKNVEKQFTELHYERSDIRNNFLCAIQRNLKINIVNDLMITIESDVEMKIDRLDTDDSDYEGSLGENEILNVDTVTRMKPSKFGKSITISSALNRSDST